MKNHDIPRPEYPRPQFIRDKWLNLNGTWEFLYGSRKYRSDMTVPGNSRIRYMTESEKPIEQRRLWKRADTYGKQSRWPHPNPIPHSLQIHFQKKIESFKEE